MNLTLAACTGHQPSLWDHEPGHETDTTTAMAICTDCPIRPACLASALANEGGSARYRYGIFGATTPQQRADLHPAREPTRCGTTAMYAAHKRAGEAPCPPCQDAMTSYERARPPRTRKAA